MKSWFVALAFFLACSPQRQNQKKNGDVSFEDIVQNSSHDQVKDDTRFGNKATPGSPDIQPKRENTGVCNESAFFRDEVWPLVQSTGCLICHSQATNPFVMKNAQSSCAGFVKRSNFNNPPQSLILSKPTQQQTKHLGGTIFSKNDPLYSILLTWIDRERGVFDTTVVDDHSRSQRIRILSNDEYSRTVTSIFGESVAVNLENDRGELFANQLQSISSSRTEKYIDAAYSVASKVSLNRFDKCSTRICLEDFAVGFAELAWRRVLSDSERSRLRGFVQKLESSDMEVAQREVIAAVLSSFKFFSRRELGVPSQEGGFKLSANESANFLSYSIYGLPPSKELIEKISGINSEGLKPLVAAMLQDPRSTYLYDEFIQSLFQTNRLGPLKKEDPLFTEAFKVSITNEIAMLFKDFVAKDQQLFENFWTSEELVPDPLTQSIYIPSPQGFPFPGLVSRSAFQSINAEFDHPNPIKRGAKIVQNFLCRKLPPPPQEATEAIADGTNSREFRAANPSCANCHRFIDPIGYSMEHFSIIGKVSVMQHPQIEKTILDGAEVSFQGISGSEGLHAKLAKSDEARRCFTQRWYEFIMGLPLSSGSDFKKVSQWAEDWKKHDSFKTLLIDMISDSSHFQRH